MSNDKLKELEVLALPIAKWLAKEGHAYPEVTITLESIIIRQSNGHIPILYEVLFDD